MRKFSVSASSKREEAVETFLVRDINAEIVVVKKKKFVDTSVDCVSDVSINSEA